MTERLTCASCGAPVSGERCATCGEAVAVQPLTWSLESGWTRWPEDGHAARLIRPYVPVGSRADDDATAELAPAEHPAAVTEHPATVTRQAADDMYDWTPDEPESKRATVRAHRAWPRVLVAVLVVAAVAVGVRLIVFSSGGTDSRDQASGPTLPVVVLGPSTAQASVSSAAEAPIAASVLASRAPQQPSPVTSLLGGTSPAASPPTFAPRTVAISGGTGRCLDNAYSRQVDQNPVVMFTCNGTGAQQWTFNPDGTLSIGRFCLQISFGYITDRGLTQMGTCTGSENQQWRSRPDSTLLHVGSGWCLRDATSSGTGVMNPYTGTYWGEVTACSGSAEQRWSL